MEVSLNRPVGGSNPHEHAVADGPGVARMTCVNVPERMTELSDGVTRPFNATTAGRRGSVLEIRVEGSGPAVRLSPA